MSIHGPARHEKVMHGCHGLYASRAVAQGAHGLSTTRGTRQQGRNGVFDQAGYARISGEFDSQPYVYLLWFKARNHTGLNAVIPSRRRGISILLAMASRCLALLGMTTICQVIIQHAPQTGHWARPVWQSGTFDNDLEFRIGRDLL
jgi:hypothetical protein